MKGWYGNKYGHSLASRGIRSRNKRNMKAFGERYDTSFDGREYNAEDVEIYLIELNEELGENAKAIARWSAREYCWNIIIIEEE